MADTGTSNVIHTTCMEDSSEDSSDEDVAMIDIIRVSVLMNTVKSVFEKTPHVFFPQDKFEKIFTVGLRDPRIACDPSRQVLELLGIATAAKTDLLLSEFIRERARKVFLTCIMSLDINSDQLHRAMLIFMHHGFDDDKLPIEPWSAESLERDVSSHPFASMERMMRRPKRRAMRVWTVMSIHRFSEKQWEYMAPTFSFAKDCHYFGSRQILPFISDEISVAQRTGSYSSVARYVVHPAHLVDREHQVMILLPFLQTTLMCKRRPSPLAMSSQSRHYDTSIKDPIDGKTK
jgi:hypothetical protein